VDGDRSTFGQYTVLAPIGDDCMLVQRAAEAGFARLLVIRALDGTNQNGVVEHMLSQAKLAARLHHPNVRQIHEVGKADGQPYIAFEYLEGIRFDELLTARSRGKQLADPRLYCALLAQSCEGLHQAHRARIPGKTTIGLIHGCLRPERLFVTSGGTVKLLGFGMRELHTTVSADEMGQPERYAYLSPEQVLGRQADIRSDVFSVGILVWESLTGRRLFSRKNRVEVLRAITQNPIPPPNALTPTIPPPLNHVVVRALARNPDERFQSARELGVALEEGVSTIGSPLSTVAIAAAIDRFFNGELEAQRSIILKARRELEAAMSDDLDVMTELFEGDTDINVSRNRLPRRSKPQTEPETPRAKTGGAGRVYERPPDTLSDVGKVPQISALGDDHGADIAAMIEEVSGPVAHDPPDLYAIADEPNKVATATSRVAPARRRIWLMIFLVLILAAAAGAAGYVYWLDQQAVTK
jgi:serine/threonine-protein kinase